MACNNITYASNRRDFLRTAGCGFGAVALSALLGENAFGAGTADTLNPVAAKLPHRFGKAKSVIFLFMEGGPSHLDTFDYKPLLNELDGQPLPPSFKQPVLAMGEYGAPILGSKRAWKQHGESGLWVSDWFSNVANHVDDLAVIRSCHSNGINHAGGVCQMNTGSIFGGRPSLGAWVTYGLGTENQNLPAFVVLKDSESGVINGVRNWGTGFMPAVYQGVEFSPEGVPIKYLDNPKGMTPERQREKLDLLAGLNGIHAEKRRDNTELEAGFAAMNSLSRCRRRLRSPWIFPRNPKPPKSSTAWTSRKRRCMAETVSWHVVWWKTGCALSSSTVALAASGTLMPISRAITASSAVGWTFPSQVFSQTSSLVACWRRRLSSGAVNLVARPSVSRVADAITTRLASRCGWRVAVSKAGRPSDPRTSWDSMPWKTACMCMTSTPP
nr:DUF1501 domain-containing protein [Verrucomicrobium spinosum]